MADNETQPPYVTEPSKFLGYHIAKEWPHLKAAPLAVFAVFVIGGVVGYFISGPVIAAKNATIEGLQTKRADLEAENGKLSKQISELKAGQPQTADTQYLVKNLFSNMRYEDFRSGATSNVFVLPLEGDQKLLLLKLNHVPITDTIQCRAEGLITGEYSLSPMKHYGNIAYAYVEGDANPIEMTFHAQYVQDARETNNVQMVSFRDKKVIFDGREVILSKDP